MSEELKPCPFCGGKAVLLGGPQAQECHSVWCLECSAKMQGGMQSEPLVEKWNARPAPAVQVPEGMALVSRDEAISVLEGVANIVHVCWSEWGAAGSWSDYDQSVMEGMHALQAKLAAATAPATVAIEAVVQECDGCKSQGRYAHSTQCRYAHFLAYSGLTGDSALRYAYFHGAHTDCEKPEAVAQGGGVDVEKVMAHESELLYEIELPDGTPANITVYGSERDMKRLRSRLEFFHSREAELRALLSASPAGVGAAPAIAKQSEGE